MVNGYGMYRPSSLGLDGMDGHDDEGEAVSSPWRWVDVCMGGGVGAWWWLFMGYLSDVH